MADATNLKIGLALGAGGAAGLAHILMLEVFDELKLRPYRIAGASIGAIVGALYASGLSADRIRTLVEKHFVDEDERALGRLFKRGALRLVDFVDIELRRGGLLSGAEFYDFIYDTMKVDSFGELAIPMQIVASDFWNREQVVLDSGKIIPAISASMALPGVFQPVVLEGRVLIDGGLINPVPYDLLMDDCDIVVAVDVIGERSQGKHEMPGYFETLFQSVKVMQAAIMQAKLSSAPPHIYVAPAVRDVRSLQFHKAGEVLQQSLPAKAQLRDKLVAAIEEHASSAR